MTKLFLILGMIAVFAVGVFGQTATPTPLPVTGQPNAEELKQAKETLRAILSEEKPPEKGKSVVDVMDKGLDLLSGYVSTLEGVVSKYAPEVWRIMITQQYSKAIGYPAFWGLMLLSVVILRSVIKRYFGVEKGQAIFARTEKEKNSYSDEAYWARVWFVGIIPTALAIPLTIVFLYCFTEAIMIFINPEYYALKDIIQMLR